LERGVDNPSWATLRRLADAFDVDFATFGAAWLPLC
jgi:hypothetical protein